MKCKYRKCDVEVEGRKKYCSPHHKWLESNLVKYEERNLPPKTKRTREYFYMSTGAAYSSMRGQGKRTGGGMIKGGMSARVLIEQQQIALVTPENLRKHFEVNNGYRKNVRFCDETEISKEEAIKEFNL